MPSLQGDRSPAVNEDGTLTGIVVQPAYTVAAHTFMHVALPSGLASSGELLAGRYFLARCGTHANAERDEAWSIYLRRPLFVVEYRIRPEGEEWRFSLSSPAPAHPHAVTDPGYAWLARQPRQGPINLIGPLGNGFSLHPHSRNFLLLADLTDNPGWLDLLRPSMDPLLDRGNRVTLLVHTAETLPDALLSRLPIDVEVRTVASDAEWDEALHETVRWADQIYAGISSRSYLSLAEKIRNRRFRLEEGFTQVLVQADLVCGTGACLACIVPLRSGSFTRACVHGPVFDLTRLVGR